MKSAVARYLPKVLREWQLYHRDSCHVASEHRRILLFADASGFTVLTRNLSLRGRVGFEHLTNLLNTLFNSLADVIASYNGDILKFSGDAVWCCFPDGTDIYRVYAEMLTTIEIINREQEVCRQFPLSLHAGASRGSLELLTIAAANGRAEFEIAGSAVLAAYRACDLAKSGELCLTADLAEDLPAMPPVRTENNFLIVTPPPLPISHSDLPSDSTEDDDAGDNALLKYVPEALLKRILATAEEATLGSEHRQVCVAFVNVQPLGEKTNSASLAQHLAKIMNAIHDSQGIVARIDPFGSGHKVLALFGAIVATGNDALRTLKAAVEIAAIQSSDFATRLGLTAGPLLCGEVGSHRRCEFTVMGNAVNLAARLMTKADPSGLLLDEQIHKAVANSCRTRPLQLSLKGFDLPVTVQAFESLREHQVILRTPRQFFGRVGELARLREVQAQAASTGPVWLAISGAAGVGKTSLAAMAVAAVDPDNVVYLDASDSHLRRGGWLIYELLRRALGAAGIEDLLARLEDCCEPQWLSLIAGLVDASADNKVNLQDLTPELRAAKTAEIAARGLGQSLNNKILILDNLESLDSLSASILRSLIPQFTSSHCLILLIDDDNRWADTGSNMQSLAVEGLPESDLRSWLGSVLVTGKRESDLTDHLVSISAGNPVIIEETLQYLIKSQAIAHISDSERFDMVAAVGDAVLSGRLEELQLARFDQLREEHRNLLKAASVYPHTFTAGDLVLLKNDWGRDRTEAALVELCEADMLFTGSVHTDSALSQYRFCRSILRETVYNRTPVLQLRAWHSLIADNLRWAGNTLAVQDLAYHLARSNRPVEAFHFNLKAAILSIEASLSLDASSYFRECSNFLSNVEASQIPDFDKFEYFRYAAGFYVAEGDYRQAHAIVRAWRRQARMGDSKSEQHAAANQFALLLWKQSRYSLCRSALDYIDREFSDSDISLLIDTHALRGELQRRTGKIKEAQESCRKAVSFAQNSGDLSRQAHSLNNLGLAFWSGGNLDEASQCFEQCLTLHEAKNSRYLSARTANNLSIISEERGDYIRAQKLANRAQEIFAEYGDRRNQSFASGNLANLLVHAGRIRQASELFATADRIFVHLGETHPHYYTIGNLGDIDLLLGRLADAKAKYQTVLEFARNAGDKELEAETAVRLTECAFYGGEAVDIEKHYREAIATAKEAESLEYQTRATVGLCRYLIGVRDANSSRAQIEQLRVFAAESKSLRTQNESEFLQGEVERITGSSASAVNAYQRCCEYARNQDQFELYLKSLVRLAEIDRESAKNYLTELALLLNRFTQWNGDALLTDLLSSSYYRYFHVTLAKAVKLTNVGVSQHTVG